MSDQLLPRRGRRGDPRNLARAADLARLINEVVGAGVDPVSGTDLPLVCRGCDEVILDGKFVAWPDVGILCAECADGLRRGQADR